MGKAEKTRLVANLATGLGIDIREVVCRAA